MARRRTQSATAALEAAAGSIRACVRGSGSDASDPGNAALTPAVLALMARDLIRRGESVHVIEVGRDGVRLTPAGSWDVRGGFDPLTWRYRCDVFGPSGNIDPESTGGVRGDPRALLGRPGSAVVWYRAARVGGVSPASCMRILRMRSRMKPAASAVTFCRCRRGRTLTATRTIRTIRTRRYGRILRTAARRYRDGRNDGGTHGAKGKSAAPLADLEAATGSGRIRRRAWRRCGPIAALPYWPLADARLICSRQATRAGQRESWRRFLHGSVQPLGDLLAAELAIKLDVPGLRLDFNALFASDLSPAGRGRSARLVKAGMEMERAARLAGLS